MRHKSFAILLPLLLTACAAPPARPVLFQKILAVRPDGSAVEIPDNDLSPFQRMLHSYIPSPAPTSILAVEVEQPDSLGNDGTYLAVLRTGNNADLRFFESVDHAPRLDRYFHRELTSREIAALDAFIRAHPMAQLAANAPAEAPTAATQPAAAATAPATAPASAPAEVADASATPAQPLTIVRITYAQPKETRTATVVSPPNDSPAAQLLALFDQLRHSGNLVCNYVLSYPPAARLLFSDPQRHVLQVWTREGDLRAVIARVSAGDPNEVLEPQWFALQNDRWTPSAPPPEPAPATASDALAPLPAPLTSQTAASPDAAASQPAITLRFTNPGMLPDAECWWTQGGPNYTTVWHYLPLSQFSGVKLGFIVPTFLFDDNHMAVDKAREMLYLIHEGQLFAVPIPKRALSPQ